MGDKKELPRYLSKKYNAEFGFDNEEKENGSEGVMIKKFKRDGELNSETTVRIEDCYDREKRIYWHRKTVEGEEKIFLGEIRPTDSFLEFLDRFTKKKKVGIFLGSYHETTYGIIIAACNMCLQNECEFKKMVRKAKNIGEFLSLWAVEAGDVYSGGDDKKTVNKIDDSSFGPAY